MLLMKYMVSEVWEPLTTFEKYYDSQTPSMFNFDAGQKQGLLFGVAKGLYPSSDYVDAILNIMNIFRSLIRIISMLCF